MAPIADQQQDKGLLDSLHREYLVVANQYSHIIDTREIQESNFNLTESDISSHARLFPEAHQLRLEGFVNSVLQLTDDSLLNDLQLTNRIQIRALLSVIYNKLKLEGYPTDDEFFSRAIAPLVFVGTSFNNYSGDTEETINNFLSPEPGFVYKDHGTISNIQFGNFLALLVGTTLPITDHRQDISNAKYQGLMEITQGTDELVARCKPYIKNFIQINDEEEVLKTPVFVGNIRRTAPYTNDMELESTRSYSENQAKAITGFPDQFTGLPLVFSERPSPLAGIGIEDDQEVQDSILEESRTALHEYIHIIQPNSENTLFDLVIREMLTDSSAEIILLNTLGIPYANQNLKESSFFGGYSNLRHFIHDLVTIGLLDEDSVVDYALTKNSQDFLNYLDDKLSTCPQDQLQQAAVSMISSDIILPVHSDEMPTLVEQLRKNPSKFIKENIQHALDIRKSEYFHGFYSIDYLGFLIRHKHYAESKGITNLELVLDPDTGLYTDFAVDAIVENADISPGLVNPARVSEIAKSCIGFEKISGIPDEFQISQLPFEVVEDLLQSINSIILNCYNQEYLPVTETLQSKRLINVTNRLYRATYETCLDYSKKSGLKITHEDIINLISDTFLEWQPEYNWRVTSVKELNEFLIGQLKAFLTPVETPQGLIYPNLSQVQYWGKAMAVKD